MTGETTIAGVHIQWIEHKAGGNIVYMNRSGVQYIVAHVESVTNAKLWSLVAEYYPS